MAAGTRPTGSDGKPVPRHGDGKRACSVCGARLTSYNPGPNCYRHTADIPWRGPAAPPR